jgi:DNA-binding HxlR family transcriptional regulator
VPIIRSYDDPCGIARALDIVGDRWALLIVRELIFGPKRFVQMRAGLHGISPNVLSQRLRELEDAGIVHRDVLDPPASVAVYELTDRGRALEPILIELGSWGRHEQITSSSELSVSAFLLALETVLAAPSSVTADYALRVDGEWFTASIADGAIDIVRGRTERPDASFDGDVATLRDVAFGRESISDAERAGRLAVAGDRRVAQRFPRLFRL